MDNDIGFKSISGVGSLTELCEILEDNNKILSWLLKNLSSNNIISIDPEYTKIEGENISIDEAGVRIVDSYGGIIADISKSGAICGGAWNFSNATVSGI